MQRRCIFVVWAYLVVFVIVCIIFQWYIINPTCCCHMDEDGHFVLPLQHLHLSDYTRLINLKNFRFLTADEVCQRHFRRPWVLIMVHSAPGNFKNRDIIRNTWGRRNRNFKILFLLGTTTPAIQRQLDKEHSQYHDFVQGNFKDAYRNMTYKHVMLMKYVVYHCSKAKFVIKVDDDVFVNVKTILDFFNYLPTESTRNMLICKPNSDVQIVRNPEYKWYVTKKEYPYTNYPPYCAGFAIIYSTDSIYKLYVTAQEHNYFWIDDVFVTGFLVPKTRLQIVDMQPAFDIEFDGKIPDVCDYFFSDADFSSHHLMELDVHNRKRDDKLPCELGALQQDMIERLQPHVC